jgi:hypothetical protein
MNLLLDTASPNRAIGSRGWTPDQIPETIACVAANVRTLERRIERIKQKLTALGDLRPGHLSEQYNVCGNPRCRCKADPPQRHGPYPQLGWTRKGRSTTRFIRKPDVPTVQAQLRNHEHLLNLVDQWIDAAIELCDLKLKESRNRSKSEKGN